MRTITSLNNQQKKWIENSRKEVLEHFEIYGLQSQDDPKLIDLLVEDLESNFDVSVDDMLVEDFVKTLK